MPLFEVQNAAACGRALRGNEFLQNQWRIVCSLTIASHPHPTDSRHQ
jgi:hypothetical protein